MILACSDKLVSAMLSSERITWSLWQVDLNSPHPSEEDLLSIHVPRVRDYDAIVGITEKDENVNWSHKP